AVVGRLTAIKRPDRMLAVARLVRDAVPGTVFVVCGAGDRLAATAAEAAAQQLDIRFLGWRPDVETVYAAADLTLLTSDNEGLPVCLVEAGLAGRAAVATDVGGVAEVVLHERTGLLARPDAGELSAHVVRLLRDPELRGRMGRAAQEFTGRHYGSARLVADTAALYERLGAR
ncbi:MAG TPA: glycosyltransferase, partial [Rugosimonospora sp.]|nr:glycosyltransferase [Rugosimonospora sp.]